MSRGVYVYVTNESLHVVSPAMHRKMVKGPDASRWSSSVILCHLATMSALYEGKLLILLKDRVNAIIVFRLMT
jgi:hypothetical protein